MAIAFITWLWGDKYGESDVAKLAAGLRRHHVAPYRFVVFTDRMLKGLPSEVETKPILDPELIGRGCFCRLRMFDPDWQRLQGFDGRIASLDLDAVICRDIEPIFHRSETFLILQGVNAANPCPYNASLMMLRAGQHSEVWTEFNWGASQQIKFYEFPDDQGWIWHMLPKAAGWKGGTESGVYAFQKPGWPRGNDLPADARIVAFFGWRKPRDFMHLPWVRQHWSST